MARQRLTNATLQDVARTASAEQTVALAERLMGPGATDREVVAAAKKLQALGPVKVRELRAMSERVATETSRMAGNGGEDVLPEAGPAQPDPTDTQAYVKEIETTPDHAVLDSLTKKDKIAPTAGRKPKTKPRKAELFDDGGAEDLSESESHNTHDFGDEGEDCECPPTDEGGFDLDEDDHDLESMLEFAADEDGGMGHDEFEDADGIEDHDSFDEDDDMHEEMSDDLDDDADDHYDDTDDTDEDLDGILENGDDVQEPDIVDEDELDDEDEPEDFLDEDETDVAHAGRHSSRRASAGRFSLEDTVAIEDQIGGLGDLEGDDLEALMGSKRTRTAASNKGIQAAMVPGISAHDRQEGFTWDTENEPELNGGRPRKASRPARQAQKPHRTASRPVAEQTQIRKPKPRRANKAPNFAPDRRRVAGSRQASAGDEFDGVFGAPDVNSFFND